MKLSDKVVSLEIAQKLYDMGVRIETEFVWCVKREKTFLTREENIAGGWHYIYPAPLACEILDVLPEYIVDGRYALFFRITKSKDIFMVAYTNFHRKDNKKLSDALALMLIHLLENNLIKLEDVNR